MWEPWPGATILCFGSTLGVYALVWYGFMVLYRYWNQNFRYQRISGAYQTVSLIIWLLEVAITVLGGLALVAFFTWLVVIYLTALAS